MLLSEYSFNLLLVVLQKKSQDAVKVLREIGQTNGKIIPDDLEAKVNKLCNATKVDPLSAKSQII